MGLADGVQAAIQAVPPSGADTELLQSLKSSAAVFAGLAGEVDNFVKAAIDAIQAPAAPAPVEPVELDEDNVMTTHEYLKTAANRELVEAIIDARGAQSAAWVATRINQKLMALGKVRPVITRAGNGTGAHA